jgi:hypothetical protein
MIPAGTFTKHPTALEGSPVTSWSFAAPEPETNSPIRDTHVREFLSVSFLGTLAVVVFQFGWWGVSD